MSSKLAFIYKNTDLVIKLMNNQLYLDRELRLVLMNGLHQRPVNYGVPNF